MKRTLLIGAAFCVIPLGLWSCAQSVDKPQAPPTQISQNTNAKISEFETSLRRWEERGVSYPDRFSIPERMAHYGVPGASVAIIDNGKLFWINGYGVRSANSSDPIDTETVFSAGSVSKLINAALILRLVQIGQLDLSADVNEYLKSWKVPDTQFTAQSKVTLRHLLSHTSGFSQHGFRDFQPGEKLPTAIQTVKGEAPAKHNPVTLTFRPGEKMDYSGGGITVSQVLVEDVTGLSYPEAAQKFVFGPLGMTRSTFVNPLPESHGNIARAHNKKGKARALPRGYEAMPEMAASGLWTSAQDMTIFVQAIMNDDTFLSPFLRKEMLTRAPNSWHGLGPRLNGSGDEIVFHHGGANDSYQTWVEGHPSDGNAFIAFTNGEDGRRLAYEMRIAAEEVLGWSVNFPDDYEEPNFE